MAARMGTRMGKRGQGEAGQDEATWPSIQILTGMETSHVRLVLRSMAGRSSEYELYPPTSRLANSHDATRVPPNPAYSTNLRVGRVSG